MRTKSLITGILAVFMGFISQAQTELWYFGGWAAGGTGLSFTGAGNSPVANTTGGFPIYEAISVVADGSGNAIFYTDGLKVYDATHSAMSNGTGMLGSQEGPGLITGSSLNGVIVTYDPGDPNGYYIITINDIENGTRQGLNWHHVDMTGNGGLGVVTAKNQPILDGNTVPTAEMMTAASAPCSDTIWIVTHGGVNNNFYATPITPSGVDVAGTVTSSVGPVIVGGSRRGSFAFNSDASMLAMAAGAGAGAWLFNFDPSTGVVSASTEGLNGDGQISATGHYGVEFSPDDRKVYFSGISAANNIHYNLDRPADNLGNGGSFNATSNPSLMGTEDCGMIETGLDGRLYVGRSIGNGSLGVIANPNAVDAASCGWSPNGQPVPGSGAWYGLPQMFLPDYSSAGVNGNIVNSDTALCDTSGTFTFSATPTGGIWSTNITGFINGSTGELDITGAVAAVGDGGSFKVYYGGNCIVRDSITVTVNVCCQNSNPNIGNDTTICDNDIKVLDAGAGYLSYQWLENGVVVGSGQTFLADSGTYVVNVINPNGCPGTDTIEISNYQLPVVDLGGPHAYCATDSFQLDAGAGFTNYSWTLGGSGIGGNTQTYFATSAGVYAVTVTDGNGCSNSDNATVTENALPVPSISGNTIVCQDSTTLITGTAGSGGTLSWSGIAPFVNPLPVTSAGTYWLIEQDGNGCIDSVSYTMTLENLPNVNLGGPFNICYNQQSQLLDASTGAGGETYIWKDLSTGSTFTANGPDTVWVAVISANGCIALDTAVVDTFPVPIVNLGPDTFYCAGADVVLDAGAGFTTYAWSTTESSQTISVSTAGQVDVVVTDANGCMAYDTVQITENALPIVDLGPDTTLCELDTLILVATHPDAASYVWNPGGSTNDSLTVQSTTGTYQVTITDVDGCDYTASRTITQEDLPVVDLGGNDTICGNTTKTLDAGNPGYSYMWFLDFVATGETGQTIVADSGTYAVVVSSALGCMNYDTVLIHNYEVPVVDLGNDTSSCDGIDLVLDADTANDILSYAWSTGGIGRYETLNNYVGSVSVIVTDTNNCSETDAITVGMFSLPFVDLGADDSACVGLVNNYDVTLAGATYLWSDNSTAATFTLSGPDTIWVQVTDANGCVNSDTVGIKALAPLSFDLVADPDTALVCENALVTFTIPTYSNPSITWTFGGSVYGNGNSITPDQSGWYHVDVTDENNCQGNDSVYVTIVPVPNINLGPDTFFCSLGQETYTIQMVQLVNIDGVISWSADNNNSADTAFTATYAPDLVWGQLVDLNGCVHRDTVNLTEFCEPTKLDMPDIFTPGGENPVFTPIGINTSNFQEVINNIVWSDFVVYDRWGVKVYQTEDYLPRWDGYYQNRPVSSGVYFWVWKYKDSALNEYTFNGFVQVVQLN